MRVHQPRYPQKYPERCPEKCPREYPPKEPPCQRSAFGRVAGGDLGDGEWTFGLRPRGMARTPSMGESLSAFGRVDGERPVDGEKPVGWREDIRGGAPRAEGHPAGHAASVGRGTCDVRATGARPARPPRAGQPGWKVQESSEIQGNPRESKKIQARQDLWGESQVCWSVWPPNSIPTGRR